MCSNNIDLGRSLPVPQVRLRHRSSKANKKRQINSGMQKNRFIQKDIQGKEKKE